MFVRIFKNPMDLVSIHECLSNKTRLRVVHLLQQGPLCVCHLQEVLREPQVKMSRHLAYLLRRGMVLRERCGHWMIYRLPTDPPPLLASQLACLQDAAAEVADFRRDKDRLAKVLAKLSPDTPSCVGKKTTRPRRSKLSRP
jgi:ArsR family transcriptional regulator